MITPANRFPDSRTFFGTLPACSHTATVAELFGTIAVPAAIIVRLARRRLRFTLAFIGYVHAHSSSHARIGICLIITAADRIILERTNLRSRPACPDTVAVTRFLGAIAVRIAIVVGLAGRRLRFTLAFGFDVYARSRRKTLVRIRPTVTTANRFPEPRTGIRARFTDAGTVTVSGPLRTVLRRAAITVVRTRRRSALAAVVNVNAGHRRNTLVRIRLTVAPADRIPEQYARLRARFTRAFAVAVAGFLRTIVGRIATHIVCAWTNGALPFIVDINTGHRGKTLVRIRPPIAPANRGPKPRTSIRTRRASAGPVTIARSLGTILTIGAFVIRAARTAGALTFIVDIFTGHRGKALVRISDAVAPADRLKDQRTSLRTRLARAPTVAVARRLRTVFAPAALVVATARRRHTFTRIIDIDARRCCVTCIRISPPVASANRVPDIRAAQRTRLARTFAVAVTFGLGAVLTIHAVIVARTSRRLALARIIHADPGCCSLAGIAVSLPVTTAHRVPDIRTHPRPTFTGTLAVAVTLGLGAIIVRIAMTVALTRPGALALVIHTDAGPGSNTAVRISHPVTTANRLPDHRAIPWSRRTHTLAITFSRLLRAVIVRATVVAGITRGRSRFTFALVVDVHSAHSRHTGVCISTTVTTANRIPKLRTGLGPRFTRPLAVAIARRLGAVILTIAVVIALARNRSRLAFTAIVDTHAAGRGNTCVRISPTITTANRVPQRGTYPRSRFTRSLTVAIARFLGAVAVVAAVLIGFARNRSRLAFALVIHVDTGGSGIADVRIGPPVTPANRGPQINAYFGPSFTNAAPVTIARPLRAVFVVRTFVVGRTYVRHTFAVVLDIYPGHRRGARIRISPAVTATNRIPNQRAYLRPSLADSLAVTVAGSLGAVIVRAAIVIAAARRRRTFTLIVHIYSRHGRIARIRISHTVTTTNRRIDLYTILRTRLACALTVAVALGLGAIVTIPGAIRIRRAHSRLTFAFMTNINARGMRFARIAIRLPVTPANRIPNIRTNLGTILTNTFTVTVTERLGAVLALTTITVRVARCRTNLTLTLVPNIHAHGSSFARITIRPPVAATNRHPDIRATLRTRRA